MEIYSDGSGLDGKVGEVVVMFKRGQGAKTLRYSLGELTEHTVYKAEAVGVVLALHMLSLEWDVRWATIHLDNKVVLGALMVHRSRPVQKIINEIVSHMEDIWCNATDPAFWLEIGWVKEHNGDKGNEKADLEAKEVAKGKTSRA